MSHWIAVTLGLVLALPAGLVAQDRGETRPPSLTNLQDVGEALRQAFPAAERPRHVGQVARMRIHVTVDGSVDTAAVQQSSGDTALDRVAARVARSMRFTPALNAGQPIPLWVVLPLQLQSTPTPVGMVTGTSGPTEIPLLNRPVVEGAVRALTPPQGEGPGLQFRVTLALGVDGDGLVQQVAIDTSSCLPSVDAAAMSVAGMMRFAAAESSAVLRGTLVQIHFGVDSTFLILPADRREPKESKRCERCVPPALTNRDDVRRTLEREYPRALRERGVGGTATIWVLVDDTGVPSRRQVQQSSGYCALDFAALRVARGMRFTPGIVDGAAKPLWVRLPIVFKTSSGRASAGPPSAR